MSEPTLAVEAIDAAESQALLGALWEDLRDRYVDETMAGDHDVDFGRDAYLADLQPEQVRPPRGAFVVVRLDGAPVACGALRGTDLAGVAEIKRMYVVPTARGRGLSRLVLGRLEAEANELGYERLRLETGTGQPEAMALYESSGWTATEPWPPWDRVPFSRCYGKAVTAAAP